MPNQYQARVFRTGQINALAGLLDALEDEKIPRTGRTRTTAGSFDYLGKSGG